MKKLNDAINILLTTIGERPLAQQVVSQGDSYYNSTVKKLKVYTGTVFENAEGSKYTPDGHYKGTFPSASCSAATHTTKSACLAAAEIWTDPEPVDSVVASIVGVFEAELADVAIEEAKVELLSKGFIFNTDTEWPLVPDITNTITLPYGALSVDATSASSDYIVKDNKLYNKSTHDFKFTDVVIVDIIWNIDFDDLPSLAQVVIVNMAKEKLYLRAIGIDETLTVLRQDTIMSHSVLMREEMGLGGYSIYDDGATNRPMVRTQNPTGL